MKLGLNLFSAALLLLTSFSLSFSASARTLEEVMKEMGPKLKSLAPLITFDDNARLAADALKTLSLEAALLPPADLPLAGQLNFEGLLLEVAVKSNAVEQAVVAKDNLKAAALVKELISLKVMGHDLFKID